MWYPIPSANHAAFPLIQRSSRHDINSFKHSLFTMKAYVLGIPEEKLLLDSAHDVSAG